MLLEAISAAIGGLLPWGPTDKRDPLLRAYRSAWAQREEAGGTSEVALLSARMKDFGVPGVYLHSPPVAISGALEGWRNGVPPPDMKHRSGRRVRREELESQ